MTALPQTTAKKLGLVIDLDTCVGCQACVTACKGWNDAKLHQRCGMGACQGRICGAAAHYLFGWDAPSPRPPLSPARVSTLSLAGQDSAALPCPPQTSPKGGGPCP